MKIIGKLTTLALSTVLSAGILALSAFAAESTAMGIGFVSATSLHLRAQADTASAVVATAPQRDCVVILGKTGDWYAVNYNLQTGYMHSDYLSCLTVENAELGYGEITGSGVNLRTAPSTAGAVAAVLNKGDLCYILGINNGWYKVLSHNTTGYVRSDYLKLTQIPYENKASSNSPKFYRGGKSLGTVPSAQALNGASTPSRMPAVSGSGILSEAKKYLGTAYVAGGASPAGFDCSGFVYYVLKQCGYNPARTPSAQWNQGTAVEKKDLQPGDIVFFAGTGASGISHVGIYAGNGQFIHAPNSRSTVSYSDLTSGYWSDHYYGARRASSAA